MINEKPAFVQFTARDGRVKIVNVSEIRSVSFSKHGWQYVETSYGATYETFDDVREKLRGVASIV